MHEKTRMRSSSFRSDNLKSKACPELRRRIQNRKLVGIVALVVTLAMCGVVAQAQQAAKVPRIGFLGTTLPFANSDRIEAFRQGLKELGYTEGKNIALEYRWAEGKLDRLPALAAELVRFKVDIIVAGGGTSTQAAKEATTTIPIAMAQAPDPVGSGFVASLARPGGNITGLSLLAPDLSGKRLELLKEIFPRLTRVTVLGDSTNPGNAQSLKEAEVASGAFALQVQYLDVIDFKDIETAFRAARNGRAEALLVLGSPFFVLQRRQIADLAAKSRLPVIYPLPEFAEVGMLMTYGVSVIDLYRRAAIYVDKILKGAKPAEMPVEQPTKFELVINLKTAKQIGLTIPPNVLARADRVIR
jgi:putative tryptophan/tyrosine transport system substrate-binding protein